jgi:hypothetical protein
MTPEVLMGAILAILFGAVLIGLAALSKVPAKRGVVLLGGILLVAGASIALGIVQIPSDEPPKAQGLFEVQLLSTSDTDRTETGENIAADGHSITYTMVDAQADGLGDIALDVRVTNQNVGSVDDVWLFSAEITYVDFTQVSDAGAQQPILNMTDFNSRWAVTYTETSAGAPTFTQEGDRAFSRDFATGASDILNIDLATNPSSMDDLGAGRQVRLSFSVGGVTLNCYITESA